MLELFLLAVSLSLDSFVIGISYRFRKIRIPPSAICIIAGVSGMITLLSVFLGKLLGNFVSPEILKIAGALVLVAMGIRVLVQNDEMEDAVKYDRDHSALIDSKEALLLGGVLSVDSIGVGIAVAVWSEIRDILLFPFLVIGLNVIFLIVGSKFFFRTFYCTKIAGVILICVGLLRLFLS